jgi:putative tryptophan/tyrosine transport system substrate-binding protein
VRRREFIALVGGAAAWPLAARAQQAGQIYRIGFLANDPTIPAQPAGRAFLDRLRESGFIEGKNIIVERRFAEGRPDRYSELMAELVRLAPDLILTSSNEVTLAAKRANTKIPIVMVNVSDPIGLGIITSLAHPGGNITGVIMEDSAELAPKRLQLLKDGVPQISKLAVLLNPDDPYGAAEWAALELGARSLRIAPQSFEARQVSEYERAFDRMTSERLDALYVTSSGLNFTHRQLIMSLAAKSRLPAVSNFKEITEAGGLMSYSSDRIDRYRHAAIYVGKILNGTTPGDLPAEGPTKYELVINLKTARALNLEISRDLLLVADEVIE